MNTRALKGFVVLLYLCYSCASFAGYRTYLDPRSMAMGGTGAASATKFNAAFHNPAMIAFNRGDKPDKIYMSASMGLRELYNHELEEAVNRHNLSELKSDVVDGSDNRAESLLAYREQLRDINLTSYRKDELNAFTALVDTLPFTVSFYARQDIREMIVIRNRDDTRLTRAYNAEVDPDNFTAPSVTEETLSSSVDETSFEINEFGVTVATTNVIDYNIPISWGYTPKLIEMRGSHISTKISDYDLSNRPQQRVSTGLLEWNLDVGFAAVLTDDFLEQELGLDGFWLEGEWVFGFVGMNVFPTDFTPFFSPRDRQTFPGQKSAIQALYQIGLAHYMENYMWTFDIDLVENEVYNFEGLTRFVSFGSEYYWRDDFHLRYGLRVNTAQTREAGKDKLMLTGGFLYQPHGFTIEASGLVNDEEMGGTLGFGIAF